MAELVRVFHKVDLAMAASAVEMLVQRTIPLLWEVNGSMRVLNPSLSAHDKVLAVLYQARRMTAAELQEAVEYQNGTQFRRKVLGKAHAAKLLNFDAKTLEVEISPRGVSYVETEIDLEVR